ncbi:hypothetical protein B6C88_08485, partial [Gilliamella apis]
HRASGIGHRASGIGHRASNLLSYSFQHFLKFKLLIIFLYPTIVPCTYGLSSFTINVIQGNSPKVVNKQIVADKYGFTVNNVFYSETTGNIKEEIKEFDGDLTFSQFVVKKFDYQELDNQINYQDIDGDGIDPFQPFLITTTIWQWFDANGNKIMPRDNQIIGCGSGYSMPLMLEISNQIQTFSQYGIPRHSDLVTIKKVYKITAISKLCYAKPYAIEKNPEHQWLSFDLSSNFLRWNDPNYTVRTLAGGGYNSDYVPNWGFKTEPTLSGGKKFPTTGFDGAKFQLVLTGAASDYTFTIPNNPGGKVEVDEKGYVTLNGKPSGNVTVRAILKRDSTIKHDYTFNPTSVWAKPIKGFWSHWMDAINICTEDRMLSYKELTNAPEYKLSGSFKIVNGYTRAIGEGLLPEWGYTVQQSYPNSNWEDDRDRYWTKDRYYGSDYGQHVDVSISTGLVGVDAEDVNAPNFLVCK